MGAGAGVWLLLAWAHPDRAKEPEMPWSIYKTTLEDGGDAVRPDFSAPFTIDNAPEIDPIDPPSA